MKKNKKYGWFRAHEINDYPIVMEPKTQTQEIIPEDFLSFQESDEPCKEDCALC